MSRAKEAEYRQTRREMVQSIRDADDPRAELAWILQFEEVAARRRRNIRACLVVLALVAAFVAGWIGGAR